ncbi:hypothetical protein [Halorussus sp. AFM4]|uniref:hypothetical protein n=1 Tax=Halorussus sp. AFM4 TaxID=3421651 RepID=UPI003EB83684
MSGIRPSPADRAREPSTALKVALGVVAFLGFAYSLLIATRPLLGALFVVWIAGFYLLWRFLHLAGRLVRAVERLADATEAPDGGPSGRGPGPDAGARDRDREREF